MRVLLGVFVMISALPTFTPALACTVGFPRSYSVFKSADILMRAKVANYEVIPARSEAVFSLDVVEMLSGGGKDIKRLVARWQNSTYGEPEAWLGPKEVIVGLRIVSKPSGGPMLEIVQQDCGPISILEDTPNNLALVQNERR
ncbi:hypothetical protein ACFSM5_17335 [Lacibacterium aquatile]|uniref:Uncharacterized protein n=1 Tax=Lacibacterium aquatile TaxID=1168082 RepID=A0ABW5DU60_9PROT